MGTVSVITSGKGGTGKTSLTAGVGCALARLGKRVLCVDGDIGLRGLDLALGLSDAALMDFGDVLAGRCPLGRAVTPHPQFEGLDLLTAPLSLREELPWGEGFQELLKEARQEYDEILLDSPAGLGRGFHLMADYADRGVVVALADPYSLRDAQRVVEEFGEDRPIRLVVNRVRPRLLKRQGTNIDEAMDTAGLPLLGLVPEDPQVILQASRGVPLLRAAQKGAAVAYRNIARRLIGQMVPLMKLR